MTCPSCRADVAAGAKFCPECGSRLALACPGCGALAETKNRFCPECGTPSPSQGGAAPRTEARPSPAESPPPDRPQPVAERRLVSVLFADLVGSTTLAEHRDPEETRELLTRYYDLCRTVIARYGGVVEKFIGDAVMAVWGTPVAQEDDPERAVRAALEVIAAAAALGGEVVVPDLRVRAGVVTGEAAVTIGAEGQGMVAGDAVNTASRIQSVAEPGTVFVDDPTRRSTDAAIVYEDVGARTLKGKDEAVQLWQAVRVVARRGGLLRSSALEAAFVGRDRELRLVKELFHGAVEEHKAQLVSVMGIAGIGKSRLSWELEKYLDGLEAGPYWHRGRCLAYGEGIGYWALAEMVRTRAEIAEGEPTASIQDKLRRALERHVDDTEERQWLEPRLGHLLGLEGSFERGDLFAAWRLYFERLSATAPVVLVFEDLQWADSGLLDFIDYLLEWSRAHPLFLLTLARPELADRRATWGSARRNFTSVYLDPLSPAEMYELLSGMVPGLPPDLRRRIGERAEGVPLYAVETVRMLLDRGALRREGDRYVLASHIEDLEVPETLHALVAARLDGLEPTERALVQDAAVLGLTFTRDALTVLAGTTGEDLDRLLSALVRKELLTVQADPRSPERGQYGFLQAIVRRVAYQTLSKRERKTRHLAVARHLEETWPKDAEDIVEVVASHYLEAHRLGPHDPDGPEVRERAERMLVRAGERAASLGAPGEAERYFAQAAGLAEDPEARAQRLERAGEMAWRAGQAEAAAAHFEAAIELYRSPGAPHPAARVSARLAEVIWQMGRWEEAQGRMEEAYRVLSTEEPDADLGALAAQLARLLFLHGQLDIAAPMVETALEIAEAEGLPELLSQALTTKSIILDTRRRREEAMALLGHALKVALDHSLPSAALRTYFNLVDSLTISDEFGPAVDQFTAGVELARKVGDRRWEWMLVGNAVYPLYVAGRWGEAVRRAAELPEPEELRNHQGVLVGLLYLIPVHVHRGSVDEARRLLAAADGLASGHVQDRAGHTCARAYLFQAEGRLEEAARAGEAAFGFVDELGASAAVREGFVVAVESALALGDLEGAEELLARVERLRRVDLTRYLRAHALRFQGRLAAARHDPERERTAFRSAETIFERLGATFALATTQLEHGEWLIEHGNLEEASPLLQQARSVFEQLGAAPWVTRAGRAEDAARRAMAGAEDREPLAPAATGPPGR